MKNLLSAFTIIIILINSVQIFSQDSSAIANIDPKIVFEKYIDAIGGRDAFAKVEDKTTIMRGSAMGQSITLIVKQKAPNKLRDEVKAGGMEQIVICDGEKASMTVMDKKIEVREKELESLKIEADMGFMLNPENFGVTLFYEGVEKINEKDAVKIKLQLPSGTKWYMYFDLESGFKVREDREVQTQMGSGVQTIDYGDYKEIEGIKYPFKIVQTFGGQAVDVTVTSIKINKGLADDLFLVAE